MNITVTKNQVTVNTDYILNDKEYNVNQCYFTFSDEYTDDLVKKAIFVQGTSTIEMSIINNQCQIPAEVLNNGQFELRVYAYEVDGNELLLRYSPSYTTAYVRTGSYIENAESPEVITPTQFEQYMQAMNDGLNEVANVDIDAKQLDDGMSVTITNRYGEDKTVYAYDGEKGETGATPNIQIGTVVTGDHSEVTRTGTNENPIFNFVLEKGDKGDTGNGIASVTKTSTSGLVDTYTITYTNGTTTTFDVTNGKSITNIAKTSTSGLEDTYTITYNDNTTSTFTVTNGNGISSIEKTGTQDNVDTYTIYYTNGTTSTFTVTNSTVTNQEFEELKAEHEELVNTLPRVEGAGESITLDNTAQYNMNVALSGNTSQVSYTGRNKANFETIDYRTDNGATVSRTGQEYSVTSGSSRWSSCRFEQGNLNLKPNTTYTFSALVKSTTSSSGSFVFVYAAGSNTGNTIQGTAASAGNRSYVTFTTPNEIDNVSLIGLIVNATDGSTVFTDIMIEESATMGDYEPYVGGVPSPNPLYPQPIKKVTGDNSITVCGKNIFGSHCNLLYKNTGTWTNAGTSVTGSTTSGGYALYDLGLLSDYVGKTLTFSFSNTPATTYGLTAFVMCENNGSNRETVSGSTLGTNSSLTVTIPSGYTQTRLAIRLYLSNVASGTFNNIQIEKNSTATTYEPYQSQTYPINLGSLEYCKIGNYSDEIFITKGKNLFDKNNANILSAYINEINSTIIGSSKSKTIYIKCNPNTTYTISKIVATSRFVIGTTTNIPDLSAICNQVIANNNATSITITTGINDNYLCAFIYHSDTDSSLTLEQVLSYIQIEKGPIATPYEPYGIGNWYIRRNIGKVILDGTEDWIYASSSVWKFRVSVSNLINNSTGSTQYWFYSNYYKAENGDNYGVGQVNNTTRIGFKNTDITTLEDFKTWLSIHNTTVYYPLQTPTSEAITDTTLIEQLNNLYNQIKSYKGQTNITQTNAELPFNIEASALYDLNNLISRVATLETEV